MTLPMLLCMVLKYGVASFARILKMSLYWGCHPELRHVLFLGECGRMAFYVMYIYHCVKYWIRIVQWLSFDRYPTRIYNKLFKLDSMGRRTLASKLQNIFLVREAFVKLCIEAVGLSVFITMYWGCRSVCISVRDNFKVACNTVGKLWPISEQETQALYSIIIRFACQPMNTDVLELVISKTTDRVTSSLRN